MVSSNRPPSSEPEPTALEVLSFTCSRLISPDSGRLSSEPLDRVWRSSQRVTKN